MRASEYVRTTVLPGGLEAAESILAIGVAETFSYTTRRLLGGLQSAYGNADATRPVERLIALTSLRLLTLDVEVRGGLTRVTAIRELRFADVEDVLTGESGAQRGFDVGAPAERTFAYRFGSSARSDLVDAAGQTDFFERAATLVGEAVRAARSQGPRTGPVGLREILPSPLEEPGFAAVVAEQSRQSEASRAPVWIARGIAVVLGLIGLFFMVIKIDHIGDGSFFRAFCIGTVAMGLGAAAGLWSVVRDARAARARGQS